MNKLKILDTNLNLHTGPIGISLSGGADSAILSYILMSNIKEHIIFLTLSNKEKNFKSAEYSTRIINKLVELTGKTNISHNIKYVDTQTRENLIGYLRSFKNYVNVMYTATTSFPKKNILNTFKSKLPHDIITRRNPEIVKSFYSLDNFFYSPFYNLDKKQIFNLYSEYDLLKTIFPLTRSCESPIISDTHCGVCWWCEERKWAFGSL